MQYPIFVANWKEGPEEPAMVRTLCHALDDAQVVICPPERYRMEVAGYITHALLGAQGPVASADPGATQVQAVILGHSSRRARGETDAMIRTQVAEACAAGKHIIVCVGELLEDRERGAANAEEVVRGQLRASIEGLAIPAGLFMVAYEPVWAISTSQEGSPTPASEAVVARMVYLLQEELERQQVVAPIFYGGSVSAASCRVFLAMLGVRGLLVGAASLSMTEATGILQAVRDVAHYPSNS